MSTLTLADAKAHLNITGSDHDAEIQGVIDAAEAAIGRRVGPLASVVKTVRVRGDGYALALPVSPAVSLTSVTPYDGDALTLADLYLDTGAAVVTYSDGSRFADRHYDVVYNAGRSTCPDDLLMAVKELVRHLWSTQRGPTKRPGSSPSTEAANTVPGAAFLLPFRVEQLITPHLQPGFA